MDHAQLGVVVRDHFGRTDPLALLFQNPNTPISALWSHNQAQPLAEHHDLNTKSLRRTIKTFKTVSR